MTTKMTKPQRAYLLGLLEGRIGRNKVSKGVRMEMNCAEKGWCALTYYPWLECTHDAITEEGLRALGV